MSQDWKTLSAVVIGAALAGWLVMRMVTGAPSGHAPPRDTAGVPAPTAAKPVEPVAEDTEPAAPVAARATAGAVAGRDDRGVDVDVIARNLEVLAQALVGDQRVEDRVMPRINEALDVPGVMAYRRAPDFWEPALASSQGANR